MRSRRGAAIAIAVAVLLGVGAVLAAASSKSSDEVANVGVPAVYPVAPIVQGATACQAPIGITEDVNRVRFNVGTFGHTGPALTVIVRDDASKQQLGSGTVQPGWVDNGSAQNVDVGTVPSEHRVAVCVRNEGPVTAYVYGDFYNGRFGNGPLGVTPTNTTNVATVDNHVLQEGDMEFALLRSSSSSLLARIPDLFDRAVAFRPPIVGAWTFWLLAALLLVGAPLALWKALVRAGAAEGSPDDRRYPDSSRP